jgi:hypothetical protein
VAIDFSKVGRFASGVGVLNCTPHPVTFLDGANTVIVEPCGAKINARAVEAEAGKKGTVVLVRTEFQQTDDCLAELAEITEKAPDVLVIGSIISAQAYPGRVLAMTPAPGFERVPPEQKRMSTTKFTIF